MPQVPSEARDGYISWGSARTYWREIGEGQPLLVLHGGPDFDHTYLLPEMDRLADHMRLIYYDQRGRGRSAENVEPETVSMGSDKQDLDAVRDYFGLETVALLGHSWGGLLALEYALQHPERVSHLILLNTAPASSADYQFFREQRARNMPADVALLSELRETPAVIAGDPDATAAYYRIHFRATVRPPELLDRLVARLRASFTQEGILKAAAIEDRLWQETFAAKDYDLLPALKRLAIPTLVLHGGYDFIPVECAEHIVQAMPAARLVVLPNCGHFSYMECPEAMREALTEFLQNSD